MIFFRINLLFRVSCTNFASSFVPDAPFGGLRMKRESGESPEQSRCCVPLCCTSNLLPLMAFVDGARLEINDYSPLPVDIKHWEGRCVGVSQKTCKTS